MYTATADDRTRQATADIAEGRGPARPARSSGHTCHTCHARRVYHDHAFARAWDVQGDLTGRGERRSAGPVDLVVAATAELHGLTLLHHDRDFDLIARVTGQATRWYGSD